MKKEYRGFTLIELLVVVVIVGILAIVFLPRVTGSTASARDAKRMANLERVHEALSKTQVLDAVALPAASGCLNSALLDAGTVATLGGEVPVDPLGSVDYTFSDGQGGDLTIPPGSSMAITGTGGWFQMSPCGAAGEFVYVVGPGDSVTTDYSYGLYARMELGENANAMCTELSGAGAFGAWPGVADGGDDLSPRTDPVPDNDACYVVLAKSL